MSDTGPAFGADLGPSADFDPADVGEIIEGLSAAIAEARRLAG